MVLKYLKGEPKKEDVPSQGTDEPSKREQEVLRWLKKEISLRKIEEPIFISDKKVRRHLEHIYQDMKVLSGRGAIVKRIR
jgi:ATP/maltotriose-dependent transcriptional regulator MalT